MNGSIWQNCHATLMILTCVRRCRGARLLRCIQPYHWPARHQDRQMLVHQLRDLVVVSPPVGPVRASGS